MWVALLRSPRNDPGKTLRRTQSGHLEHWNYFVRLTLRSVAFRRHKHSEFVPKDTQWKLQHSHSSFNRKRQFAKRNSPSKSSTKVRTERNQIKWFLLQKLQKTGIQGNNRRNWLNRSRPKHNLHDERIQLRIRRKINSKTTLAK